MTIETESREFRLYSIMTINEKSRSITAYWFKRKNSIGYRILEDADDEGFFPLRRGRKARGEIAYASYLCDDGEGNEDIDIDFEDFNREGRPLSLIEKIAYSANLNYVDLKEK